MVQPHSQRYLCGDSAAGLQSGLKWFYQHVNVVGVQHSAGEMFCLGQESLCGGLGDLLTDGSETLRNVCSWAKVIPGVT